MFMGRLVNEGDILDTGLTGRIHGRVDGLSTGREHGQCVMTLAATQTARIERT